MCVHYIERETTEKEYALCIIKLSMNSGLLEGRAKQHYEGVMLSHPRGSFAALDVSEFCRFVRELNSPKSEGLVA